MQSLAFHRLPLEILLRIFRYLGVSGIPRVRRVSRYLNQASHCRSVWVDVYRDADFVLPPGPFISQSARDLENTLVSSFRLDRQLRHSTDGIAQSERLTVKQCEIRYTGVAHHVRLVFGRFLLVALSDQVRYYDLNLDAPDRSSSGGIIYKYTRGSLQSFHCLTSVDTRGRPFACVVLKEVAQTEKRTQVSIYSLNVAKKCKVTLDLLHRFERTRFDIRSVDLGPRVLVIHGGAGPTPHTDWLVVALDVHTRTQFLLPSTGAVNRTDKTPARMPVTALASLSTSTHLLLVVSLYSFTAGASTVFKAFPLPPSDSSERCTLLSSSHWGIVPDVGLQYCVLLRDAVLDLSTQDTVVTVRTDLFEPSRPHDPVSKYGCLRLGGGGSRPSDHGEIGTITFQLLGSLGRLSRIPFVHPSLNGTSRVFYTPEPPAASSCGVVAALDYDVRGSGDDCHEVGVVRYPCVLRFPTPRTLLDYDPHSGRICLQSATNKCEGVIEVFDLV